MLADPGSSTFSFEAGTIATVVSTLPIGAEIILIGWFARTVDLGRDTVVQLLVARVLGFLKMVATRSGRQPSGSVISCAKPRYGLGSDEPEARIELHCGAEAERAQ